MKYIDLAPTIKQDRVRGPITGLDGESYALTWLDEHPDQAPGGTITESELRRIAEDSAGPGASTVMPYIKATVEALGIPIVDDPEPTNAEKLDKDIQEVDLHLTSRQLAEALIERGWTKAPEGES